MPLLLLLILLGSAGAVLIHRLGGRIDEILHENYESVLAMQSLKEALERIDSSFEFMLVARGLQDPRARAQLEQRARNDYARNWVRYEEALKKEQDNVTIHPTEDELVERLTTLTSTYHRQGKEFYERSLQAGLRHEDFFFYGGLYASF
jgi:hypothetical protein